MDTVGTVNMYNSLNNYNMLTCFHKFLDIDEYPENTNNNYMISIGIRDEDYNKLEQLYNTEPSESPTRTMSTYLSTSSAIFFE